jgi:hypothetical protein
MAKSIALHAVYFSSMQCTTMLNEKGVQCMLLYNICQETAFLLLIIAKGMVIV